MKKETGKNPFLISDYIAPEYFCDREMETEKIIGALTNRRNLTLISLRRIGKTGLIKNVFYQLADRKDIKLVYLDVFTVESINDFIEVFSTAVMNSLEPAHDKLVSKVKRFFNNFRPVINIDSITAQPSVELKIISQEESKHTLEQVFEYLKKQEKEIIIAIDEFQQLALFNNGKLIGQIRSMIQSFSNIHFIFSGSRKHMLIDIFFHPKGIFFSSTDIMYLELLDRKIYSEFIRAKFNKDKININDEGLERIFELTRGHTFYVQLLCNRLYEQKPAKIDYDSVNNVFINLLRELEVVYTSMFTLLTEHQRKLLIAIAKEESVKKPKSIDFIKKYNLTATSTIGTSIKSLLNKEMLYEENGAYFVYDVFFSEWLRRR